MRRRSIWASGGVEAADFRDWVGGVGKKTERGMAKERLSGKTQDRSVYTWSTDWRGESSPSHIGPLRFHLTAPSLLTQSWVRPPTPSSTTGWPASQLADPSRGISHPVGPATTSRSPKSVLSA